MTTMMPYARYLSYLVSLGMTEMEIIMHMHKLGFNVERVEVDSIKRKMLLPSIFKKFANGEVVDQEFILKCAKQFEIEELWRYRFGKKSSDVEEMYDLVQRKNIRLIPLILTLKGDEIVHDELKELGLEYSKPAIQLMFHYFFDIQKMNLTEWRKWFDKYAPPVVDLLDKPLNYIRYYFGITPAVPYGKILKDLMHYGYYKAMTLLDSNSKEDLSIGKTMADLSIRAGEKYEKYSGGDVKSFLEDVILEFESANIGIPSIHEIEDNEIVQDQSERLKLL